MRKIPKELENPIDNVMYDGAEILSPYLKQLNFTANGITTLSLLTGLLSINLFCDEKYELAAIVYMVSYFFDCMDGFYARKYKLVSDLGDWYDHVKDFVVVTLLLYCVMSKIESSSTKVIIIAVLIILFMINVVQAGCQQKIHNSDTGNHMLNIASYFCPSCDGKKQNIMKITRYFGPGTVNALIAFSLYYSKFL